MKAFGYYSWLVDLGTCIEYTGSHTGKTDVDWIGLDF